MTDNILKEIAMEYGTPTFVFDTQKLSARVAEIKKTVGNKIHLCYAIKANPFLIGEMEQLGMKLEVCSPGEMSICKRLNVDMQRVVFSGVNKTKQDVWQGIKNNVGIYTAESIKHIEIINTLAIEQNKVLPVLLRLTSANQFGMDETVVEQIIANKDSYNGMLIKGLHFFSGTQKKKPLEVQNELLYLDKFCHKLKRDYNFTVEKLEYGPGLRVPYFDSDDFYDTLSPLKEVLQEFKEMSERYELTIEMGRFFVSECGFYLSKIEDIKKNKDTDYCIIDGGINHVNYYGQTLSMKLPIIKHLKPQDNAAPKDFTVCGSLCTTADVIVRKFPFTNLEIGDTIALCNIGAYSVTEGVYLFLSRKMPRIVLYSNKTGAILVRDYIETNIFNSIG